MNKREQDRKEILHCLYILLITNKVYVYENIVIAI
jgi:hypothetical protein